MRVAKQNRSGVSLLEVLISIGVIALGIFGVAALIPVAQFKVAEGTSLDRQSALGPSAVSEFRIRNMNAPATWLPTLQSLVDANVLDPSEVNRPARGVVIDPLGVLAGANFFPATSSDANWRMPRFTLSSLAINNVPSLPLAQKVFYLQDDLTFDRPADESIQPRRQYFIASNPRRPLAAVPAASLSWFATLSPSATPYVPSDEFLLSVVICEGRVPELAEEYRVRAVGAPFEGAINVQNSKAAPFVQELEIGDWIMVAKVGDPTTGNQSGKVYRWTKIIGTLDDQADSIRQLTLANNDLVQPGESNLRVFFVKGVQSVFERTIRLEDSLGSWN